MRDVLRVFQSSRDITPSPAIMTQSDITQATWLHDRHKKRRQKLLQSLGIRVTMCDTTWCFEALHDTS